jgi:hypothetical protein
MPYKQVASGDYITAAWANTYVANQVVVPYSSVTDRTNNGPTVSTTGMISTLTTNTATEGIYEYNSAGQWRAPWNLPWGVVAVDNLTGTSVSITATSFTDVSGFVTPSFTPVNRRYYKVTLSVVAKQFVSGSNTASLQVVSTTPNSTVGLAIDQTLQPSDIQTMVASFWINNTATAATTYKVQAKTSGQSFSLDGVTYPCSLIVEDMGPSGAPS